MNLTISLLNVFLFLVIAWRLEFLKLGPFTYGFFAVGTNSLLHYILMPLFEILSDDPLVAHRYFLEGLLLVTTTMAGICVGTLWETRKTAPFFHRFPEISLSKRTHAILLVVAMALLVLTLSIFTGSLNPLDAISKLRSAESRMLYEKYDLGYIGGFSLGATLFLHGWLLLRVCSSNAPLRQKLLWSVGATAVTVICTASLGSRQTLFSPILSLLFVIHHRIRPIPVFVVAILFIIAIPFFVLIRIVAGGTTIQDISGFSSYYLEPTFIINEFLQRFKGFTDIVEIIEWAKHEPLQYGETFFQFFLRPIPRAFLGGFKPSSSDIFFSYAIHGRPYYGGGVHLYGGVGEMYYNFSYVGVFAWFVIVGRLVYRFHYGFVDLIKAGRNTAVAMLLTNYGLMRGLGNLGINTSGTVNILVVMFAQLAFIGIVSLPIFLRNNRGMFGGTPHATSPVQQ